MLPEHREIRPLLRSLRRPRAAENEKLAQMLRVAYGSPTARAAVIAVIEEAFSDDSLTAELARETIERCDVRGESTKVAAHEMGISVRSLFRYRLDAMKAISLVVEQALRRSFDPPRYELTLARLIAHQRPKAALDIYLHSGLPQNGEIAYDIVKATVWAGMEITAAQIERCEGPWGALALAEIGRNQMALGRLDRWATTRAELAAVLAQNPGTEYQAAAFELASLDRIDARRTCSHAAGIEACERMRALAGHDQDRLALAMIAQAEQSCSEGSTTIATLSIADAERLTAQIPNPVPIARCALAQALLSFMYERYDEAIAFASAAASVLPGVEAGFTARARALAGRAAYVAGVDWPDSDELPDRFNRVWTIADLNAARARHLQDVDLDVARAMAASAIELAVDQDARGALAFANATMAQILRAQGETDKADALSQTAWDSAVTLGDHSYLFDMFFVRHPKPVEDVTWFAKDPFVESIVDRQYELRGRPLARLSHLRPYIKTVIQSSIEAGLGRIGSRVEDVTMSSAIGLLAKKRVGRRVFTEFMDAGLQGLLEFLPYLVAPEARRHFRTQFQSRWASVVSPVVAALPD